MPATNSKITSFQLCEIRMTSEETRCFMDSSILPWWAFIRKAEIKGKRKAFREARTILRERRYDLEGRNDYAEMA